MLIARASSKNPTIAYADLVAQLKTIDLRPDDSRLRDLLDAVSKAEALAGRGMLSALAVSKEDGMPGAGFFTLAKTLKYNVKDKDKFWISEIAKLKDAWSSTAASRPKASKLPQGLVAESLPFDIPAYTGSSHPISHGLPKFYRPQDLKDWGPGITPRTRFFERLLVGMHFRLGRAVPYAFLTLSGEIRSLDAGCLKFLVNRSKPELTFNCDPKGLIESVVPEPNLVDRYSNDPQLYAEFMSDQPNEELPTDFDEAQDNRRRVVAERAEREGAGAFRAAVLFAWNRRCALSGTEVEQVVDAAHISRYNGVRTNLPFNGIALRSDIHTLFDAGLISFRYDSGSLRAWISNALQNTEYKQFSGKIVELPPLPAQRPHPKLVMRHFERCSSAASSSLSEQ